MLITVNGDKLTLDDNTTITALIESLKLAGRRIAVEVNGDIVPRSQHGEHPLKDGDVVEVVQAIGGG